MQSSAVSGVNVSNWVLTAGRGVLAVSCHVTLPMADTAGFLALQELYGVPITAVTATATTRVQKDILSILGIQNAKRFNVSACWARLAA